MIKEFTESPSVLASQYYSPHKYKTICSDSLPFEEGLKIRLRMRSFHQQFLLVFYKHYKVNISENGVCDETFQRINIPIQWHLDLLYLRECI